MSPSPGPARAQFAKPEDAIKYRQSALFVMQQNFARVAAMAAGRVTFDAKAAAESAEVAGYMSKLPWAAFGEGTDKGAPTKAKAEIWSNKAKFNDYAEEMQGELNKLNAAAKTGNLDSLKAAVGGEDLPRRIPLLSGVACGIPEPDARAPLKNP